MLICSISQLDHSHHSFNEEKAASWVVRISTNLPTTCGRSQEEPANRLHLSEIRELVEEGIRLANHPSRNISTGIRAPWNRLSMTET